MAYLTHKSITNRKIDFTISLTTAALAYWLTPRPLALLSSQVREVGGSDFRHNQLWSQDSGFWILDWTFLFCNYYSFFGSIRFLALIKFFLSNQINPDEKIKAEGKRNGQRKRKLSGYNLQGHVTGGSNYQPAF